MSGDFSRRTENLLRRAEAVCEHRGAKLTELRRQVLGMILDAASPTGAYDLLDKLRPKRRGAAPPTVYRALDFLLDQGLIHRVERLSAFVGCVAGCTAVRSRPSSRIEPREGSRKPAIICSVVVFPQPEGPRKETNSPLPTARLKSSTTVCWPNCFPTRSSSRKDMDVVPGAVAEVDAGPAVSRGAIAEIPSAGAKPSA